MMQNFTKKWAPMLCAAIVVLLLAAYLAVFLFAMLTESMEQLAVIIIMAVYCLLIGAVIWGVLAALRQRLKEIDKGEEDIARQY